MRFPVGKASFPVFRAWRGRGGKACAAGAETGTLVPGGADCSGSGDAKSAAPERRGLFQRSSEKSLFGRCGELPAEAEYVRLSRDGRSLG